MNALEKRLRILPKENFNEAMDYFTEYFEDAGPEREQQAIQDLGSPDTAAEQIITNMAIHKASVPQKGLRRNMNALWIGKYADPYTARSPSPVQNSPAPWPPLLS